MAYDMHIVKEAIAETDSAIIPLDEWFDYVANSSDLSMTDACEEITPNGTVIRIPSQGLGVWKAQETGHTHYFAYRNGEISFVYSEKGLERAHEIARALKAVIVGDEGESY